MGMFDPEQFNPDPNRVPPHQHDVDWRATALATLTTLFIVMLLHTTGVW